LRTPGVRGERDNGTVDIFTLYVGQGNLAVVVGDREAIIVDCHIPPVGDTAADFVKASLSTILRGKNVVGLLLTGLDADHADPTGVAWVLRKYQPDWVLYPKYKKLTGTAGKVFRIIEGEAERRRSTSKPLVRHSIRLDLLEERVLADLSRQWAIEVFSPHPDEMDCSNNCSVVARVAPKFLESGFSYLITGDTEISRWETISRTFGRALRSKVLAAPHHGSRSAVHPLALKLIEPSVVLVSAGVRNQFEHPHKEALDAYKVINARTYSTHTGTNLHTFEGWFDIKTETWRLEGKAA